MRRGGGSGDPGGSRLQVIIVRPIWVGGSTLHPMKASLSVQISEYCRSYNFPGALALPAFLALCLSCTANLNSGAPPHKGASPAATSPGATTPDGSPLVPPGSVSSNPSGVPTVPGPGVGPNGLPLVPATPGPTVLRRLTNAEYRNTVQDLLKLSAPPSDPLVPETRSEGYNNFSSALTVAPTLLEQYQTIAVRVAKEADIASLAPCSPPAVEGECASTFVQTFGAQAFRRPLTASESSEYLALYTLGANGATYADGIRHALETMLYSPQILYRFELGTPMTGDRRALTPYEIATEVSYLFAGGPPDTELTAAAAANALATPAQIEAHARRLLAQPRARVQLRSLLTQWLELPKLTDLTKDPVLYPTYSRSLRSAMGAESDTFIDSVLWDGDAKLATLFTAPFSFVNTELATLYGMPDPGNGAALSRQTLNSKERMGFLTQASVLASHAKPGDSAPIRRGKFVREQLLCQSLIPPPPTLKVTVPPPDPTLTTRERFARHSSDPMCAGCHALIDGVGFGLEGYDAIGHFRTEENGRPVDSAGNLTGTDVDGPFSGGVELASKLSTSGIAANCAGLQAYRWTFGRLEGQGEQEVVKSIVAQLGQGQLDVRELVVSLAKTDSFFVRTQLP